MPGEDDDEDIECS